MLKSVCVFGECGYKDGRDVRRIVRSLQNTSNSLATTLNKFFKPITEFNILCLQKYQQREPAINLIITSVA
jgi:hypothetical protein